VVRIRASLLSAVLLGSCSSETQEPAGRDKELAAKTVAFALRFHGEVLRERPDRNVFLSPVSAFFAVSMAASGAAGATRDEMAAALELKGWTRDDIDHGCHALLEWLQGGDPKVRLDVANSAWLRQDVPFHAAYVKQLEDCYRAEATPLDFKNPKCVERIDAWVNEKTHGKIPKAAPAAFGPVDILLLINAVYFKGAWESEFKKSDTAPGDFTRSDGKKKSLPFMHRTGSFQAFEADGLRAVRIPYGEKGRMSLVVVLPREGQSLTQLHDLLSTQWAGLRSRFAPEYLDLALPRFRMEFEYDLTEALAALGMKNAFSRGADFSGMSPQGRELFISEVWQKTFVDVNEEGTEAAATTTVLVKAAALPPPHRDFRVDRPFFCAVVDESTGALLFTGSIVEPN
jgi:serpin B